MKNGKSLRHRAEARANALAVAGALTREAPRPRPQGLPPIHDAIVQALVTRGWTVERNPVGDEFFISPESGERYGWFAAIEAQTWIDLREAFEAEARHAKKHPHHR